MAGLLHIYCGDGKGKTTAAVGLTVRAAGAGIPVVFAQFFKSGGSSEVKILRQIANVHTIHCQTVHGRFSNMTDAQRQQARADYRALLETTLELAQNAGLLVLDEAVSACNHGILDEERLTQWLSGRPDGLEVVLTGRNPSDRLLGLADYVTEMKKLRHPYDRGVRARPGIEF